MQVYAESIAVSGCADNRNFMTDDLQAKAVQP